MNLASVRWKTWKSRRSALEMSVKAWNSLSDRLCRWWMPYSRDTHHHKPLTPTSGGHWYFLLLLHLVNSVFPILWIHQMSLWGKWCLHAMTYAICLKDHPCLVFVQVSAQDNMNTSIIDSRYFSDYRFLFWSVLAPFPEHAPKEPGCLSRQNEATVHPPYLLFSSP